MSRRKKSFLIHFWGIDWGVGFGSREEPEWDVKRFFSKSGDHIYRLRWCGRTLTDLSDVISHLPVGLIGLLIAVILSAAMSSTASELNALGSTTTIDFYKRVFRQEASDRHYLLASKLFTVFWGFVAVAFATFASLLDNLIQAVNILGSIFYGTVLGIFLVAFFIKWVGSRAVLAGAFVAQVGVIVLFTFTKVGFLWYNLIGCLLVVCFAILFQMIPFFQDPAEQPA